MTTFNLIRRPILVRALRSLKPQVLQQKIVSHTLPNTKRSTICHVVTRVRTEFNHIEVIRRSILSSANQTSDSRGTVTCMLSCLMRARVPTLSHTSILGWKASVATTVYTQVWINGLPYHTSTHTCTCKCICTRKWKFKRSYLNSTTVPKVSRNLSQHHRPTQQDRCTCLSV